jgi:hypothetical protein
VLRYRADNKSHRCTWWRRGARLTQQIQELAPVQQLFYITPPALNLTDLTWFSPQHLLSRVEEAIKAAPRSSVRSPNTHYFFRRPQITMEGNTKYINQVHTWVEACDRLHGELCRSDLNLNNPPQDAPMWLICNGLSPRSHD